MEPRGTRTRLSGPLRGSDLLDRLGLRRWMAPPADGLQVRQLVRAPVGPRNLVVGNEEPERAHLALLVTAALLISQLREP